ncbi:TauD/TfdA family dioxygenase [Pantoea sp. 18069]|uniref:TauD/TfdA family dioxygenase n=1 Tax=Pantoea sp. 18069 TaxID=2681415 RepID=UPI0013580852|nr:TauD/TfdA family dioxygenase [Pantoea sp. 18069]
MPNPTFNVPPSHLAPIHGRSAWTGNELMNDPGWRWTLSPSEVHSLVGAAKALAGRSAPVSGFAASDFPITGLEALVSWLGDTLERGTGLARIAGLPVETLSQDDAQRIFWGLCVHLGTPVYQTWQGEIVRRVEDLTGGQQFEYQQPGAGGAAPIKSARTISASSGSLRFHTDKTDLLALMCVTNGIAGGESKIVSSVAIHNEIGRRRPDLLAVLHQPYWRMRPLDEEGEREDKVFAMPVFSIGPNGDFTSQYSRTYVNQAQEVASVPPLTAQQNEALDLLHAVADELHVQLPFAMGEMQFMNQHLTYHGRTAFTNDATGGAARLLYRIWLTPPGSRELPAEHAVQWGSSKSGSLRGGALPGQSPLVNPL